MTCEYSMHTQIGIKCEWRLNSAKKPDFLESELDHHFKVNVTAVIKTINAFMPLIRQGNIKKVIVISSIAGDADTINASGFNLTGIYGMSKSAVNTAVAMYSAIYKQEGILFMSISPGVVDTGFNAALTEEQLKGAKVMYSKFAEMKP